MKLADLPSGIDKAEIYRRAAARIFYRKEKHSCLAIADCMFDNSPYMPDECREYADMFDPGEEEGRYWPAPEDRLQMAFLYARHDARDMRVLALCFAAAMAETGDL